MHRRQLCHLVGPAPVGVHVVVPTLEALVELVLNEYNDVLGVCVLPGSRDEIADTVVGVGSDVLAGGVAEFGSALSVRIDDSGRGGSDEHNQRSDTQTATRGRDGGP